MSSQTPNPPRPRRRIAGERKGSRPIDDTNVDETTTPPPPVEAQQAPPPPPAPAVAHTTPEPDASDGAAEQKGVSGKVLAGLAALALVLVVVAAGPFVDGMGVRDLREVSSQGEIDNARRTAPAAAERAAAAILAYDYKTLEADRDAAAKLMTADYREQYLDTFEKLVSELAVERKAVVAADVRASGVALANADRVEVLLFVNQTTTSTANSGEEQIALNRVIFTMERSDGTWLVDEITPY
jgi:Mce-associated membrane protein